MRVLSSSPFNSLQQTPFGRLCLAHSVRRGADCVPEDSSKDQTGGCEAVEESRRERWRGTERTTVIVEFESKDILRQVTGKCRQKRVERLRQGSSLVA